MYNKSIYYYFFVKNKYFDCLIDKETVYTNTGVTFSLGNETNPWFIKKKLLPHHTNSPRQENYLIFLFTHAH